VKDKRTGDAVLVLIGLVCAVIGQYYLSYRREYYRDGIVFYGIAIVVFALLWRRSDWKRPAREKGGIWDSIRFIVAVIGGALAVAVGVIAVRLGSEADYGWLLWMWLAAIGVFVLSFYLPFQWSRYRDLPAWINRHRWELISLTALLVVAFGVRAIDLEHIPRNLGGDEGTWGLNGLAMLQGRLSNPFSTRWFDFPSMSFLLWGLSAKLSGGSVAGLRAPSPVFGTLAVLTTYLLAKELWGRKTGLLAAAFLTFGHYHLHYSRLAVNNIADCVFISAFFWLLVRGLRSENRRTFVWAGVVLGFSWYGYTGARLILVITAAYLGWRMVRDREFLQNHRASLLLLGVAAIVVSAPLLLHYAAHPHTFASRYNQVSIFASGWLDREQVITGRSATSLLIQQAWKSVAAFHYTVDPTFWYRPGIPLLDFISGVLVILGITWAFVFWRRNGNVLVLLWFWSAVIAGWVMTENPPSSQRLVIIGPALAILVALGAVWLLDLLQGVIRGSEQLWAAAAGILVAAVALVNLVFYFADYTPTRVYGNPTAEISDVLSDYLLARDDLPPIYFDGAPHLFWDFGAIAYRVQDMEGRDIFPEEGLADVEDDRGGLFVVITAKLDNLDLIRGQFPGGEARPFYSESDGRMLFMLYEVPAGRGQ
jgi:hypothetical protein